MTTFIDCDWCARPIDLDDDEYEPDEYNRMGFESKRCPNYVVMQATWGAGQHREPLEFGHFHFPDCWQGATRLIRDHARWAEERDAGPEAAVAPRWTEDGELKVTGLPARRELGWTEKVEIANGSEGVGNLRIHYRTFMALVHGDVLTVKQAQQASDKGALTALPDIGPKRAAEILRALERYGQRDGEKGMK